MSYLGRTWGRWFRFAKEYYNWYHLHEVLTWQELLEQEALAAYTI